jgi:hypothetical protein
MPMHKSSAKKWDKFGYGIFIDYLANSWMNLDIKSNGPIPKCRGTKSLGTGAECILKNSPATLLLMLGLKAPPLFLLS